MEWILTIIVGVIISIIGFFIKRTLDNIDTSIKALTEKLDALSTDGARQDERLKALEERMDRCVHCTPRE